MGLQSAVYSELWRSLNFLCSCLGSDSSYLGLLWLNILKLKWFSTVAADACRAAAETETLQGCFAPYDSISQSAKGASSQRVQPWQSGSIWEADSEHNGNFQEETATPTTTTIVVRWTCRVYPVPASAIKLRAITTNPWPTGRFNQHAKKFAAIAATATTTTTTDGLCHFSTLCRAPCVRINNILLEIFCYDHVPRMQQVTVFVNTAKYIKCLKNSFPSAIDFSFCCFLDIEPMVLTDAEWSAFTTNPWQ